MGIRIADTRVWYEDLQLKKAYRIAGERITRAENAYILLQTDNELYGIGAACPMPEISGETMDATFSGLQTAAELIRADRVDDLTAFLPSLRQELKSTPAAHAAIEMALLDLHCKTLGIPLVEFLGRKHYEMETSVTIGISDENTVHEQLKAHLARGFTVIKLKIGDNLEYDIEIASKLREWAGNTFRLRVDVNQGYDISMLKQFFSQTAHLRIELIEQPLRAPARAQMLTLSESQRSIIMADEELVTEANAGQLLHDRPYGVWNIKLMKSGGVMTALRIAGQAHQSGIEIMWGCNDESAASIAAALHAAFSCAATRYLDLDGSFDIVRDVVHGGFIVENGKMKLTDAPGLGVSLM